MTVVTRVLVSAVSPVDVAAPLPGLELPLVGLSVGEYGAEWIKTRLTPAGNQLRPRTRETYEDLLRLHIAPSLGELDLSRLSPSAVRFWVGRLRSSTGPGVSTAAKAYRLLRAICTTAVDDGLIAASPCRVRGAGVEPSDERPVPTVKEVFALVEAIQDRLEAAVVVAAFVGLRKGEVLGLRRSDIDIGAERIKVRLQRQSAKRGALVGPPKSVSGIRDLALPEVVVPYLRRHLAEWCAPGPDGWLMTGVKGGPLSVGMFQKGWDDARTACGVKHLHFHDLRHLAGTLAAQTGAATKEIMHRLGHSTSDASLHYQHATVNRDKELAQKLDGLIAQGQMFA